MPERSPSRTCSSVALVCALPLLTSVSGWDDMGSEHVALALPETAQP